jgi:threonine dehydrogenase-like Zn-dependent dehydrogenase
LAALVGVRRGAEVHVMDQLDHGRKPDQARALGATYHGHPASLPGGFDLVLECTGALVGQAVRQTAPVGVTCLIGEGQDRSVPAWGLDELAADLILGNKVVVGTSSSNRRHFQAGLEVLSGADPAWLAGLLGPCVGLEDWPAAFEVGADQVKAVICFQPPGALASGC